jgi:hypothetical protein
MLLAPSTAGDLLYAYAVPFRECDVTFSERSSSSRSLTPSGFTIQSRTILTDNEPSTRKGIVIEPIAREVQVEWRRNFAQEQPDPVRGTLLAALDGVGTAVFNEFARRLRENPSVMHTWNRYLQKQVTDRVAQWAAANGVSEDRWCSGISRSDDVSSREPMPTKTHSIGQRAELYNFLDSVPIEDLLQLRVPLDWVLKVTRENK